MRFAVSRHVLRDAANNKTACKSQCPSTTPLRSAEQRNRSPRRYAQDASRNILSEHDGRPRSYRGVASLVGYRIKLHFDGYQDDYDFWVNLDCPDLFYPGWCELNSRILQPPKDYGKKFNWIAYLRECQAFPASKHNFVSTEHINSFKSQHKFHIGGKLEALDKVTRVLANQLICVATVVDTLGNRVCIHLDGRTDDSDYWVDISSNNIHLVRWCDNNGNTLIPPKGYNNTLNSYKDSHKTKTFDWTEDLKETNSEPVPEDAFVHRPIRDFSNAMIIEVVDIVVPTLLRIARVVYVRNHELKIIYDGFDKKI